jgi:hypothetical protein
MIVNVYFLAVAETIYEHGPCVRSIYVVLREYKWTSNQINVVYEGVPQGYLTNQIAMNTVVLVF